MGKYKKAAMEKELRNLVYARKYLQKKCKECGHKSCRKENCRKCGGVMK